MEESLKQLLLKDLCARLPYDIMCRMSGGGFETIKNKSLGIVLDEIFHGINLSRNKGGINYLTLGEVNRIQLVRDSFILALIPYLEQNQKIWR